MLENNVVWKSIFSEKTKPPAGLHHTEVRIGDAPNPPFPIESIEKPNKSGDQPQNSRKKKPLFTSLFFSMQGFYEKSWPMYPMEPSNEVVPATWPQL